MGVEPEGKFRAKKDLSQEMAERTFKRADGYNAGQNLRQAFARSKGGTAEPMHTNIKPCSEKAPRDINVYTDGSLINNKASRFKLGAAGVWWKGRRRGDGPLSPDEVNQGLYVQPLSEGETDIGVPTQEEDGLGIAVALVGFGGSSTRSEIAGGIIAIAADGPVHIGTDSQSFRDKATKLIDMVERGRKPKRPWSTQKDGDLWIMLHEMVRQKGCESIKITKVKGHATDVNVEDGKVDIKDKQGNDKADDYATKGLEGHGDDFLKVSRMLTQRQSRYVAFVANVHDHMLEAFLRRKHMLDAEQVFKENQKETKGKKYIQAQLIDYQGEEKGIEPKEMLAVHHLGKTVKAYHRTGDVHNFIKMLHAEKLMSTRKLSLGKNSLSYTK